MEELSLPTRVSLFSPSLQTIITGDLLSWTWREGRVVNESITLLILVDQRPCLLQGWQDVVSRYGCTSLACLTLRPYGERPMALTHALLLDKKRKHESSPSKRPSKVQRTAQAELVAQSYRRLQGQLDIAWQEWLDGFLEAKRQRALARLAHHHRQYRTIEQEKAIEDSFWKAPPLTLDDAFGHLQDDFRQHGWTLVDGCRQVEASLITMFSNLLDMHKLALRPLTAAADSAIDLHLPGNVENLWKIIRSKVPSGREFFFGFYLIHLSQHLRLTIRLGYAVVYHLLFRGCHKDRDGRSVWRFAIEPLPHSRPLSNFWFSAVTDIRARFLCFEMPFQLDTYYQGSNVYRQHQSVQKLRPFQLASQRSACNFLTFEQKYGQFRPIALDIRQPPCKEAIFDKILGFIYTLRFP